MEILHFETTFRTLSYITIQRACSCCTCVVLCAFLCRWTYPLTRVSLQGDDDRKFRSSCCSFIYKYYDLRTSCACYLSMLPRAEAEWVVGWWVGRFSEGLRIGEWTGNIIDILFYKRATSTAAATATYIQQIHLRGWRGSCCSFCREDIDIQLMDW